MIPPVELIVPFETTEVTDAAEVGDETEVLPAVSPVVTLLSALVAETLVDEAGDEAVSLAEDVAPEVLLPDPTESQNLLTAGIT